MVVRRNPLVFYNVSKKLFKMVPRTFLSARRENFICITDRRHIFFAQKIRGRHRPSPPPYTFYDDRIYSSVNSCYSWLLRHIIVKSYVNRDLIIFVESIYIIYFGMSWHAWCVFPFLNYSNIIFFFLSTLEKCPYLIIKWIPNDTMWKKYLQIDWLDSRWLTRGFTVKERPESRE